MCIGVSRYQKMNGRVVLLCNFAAGKHSEPQKCLRLLGCCETVVINHVIGCLAI